jgi:hypothetical protein
MTRLTKKSCSSLLKGSIKQMVIAIFLVFCISQQNINSQNAPYRGVDEKTMSKLGWKVAIQCWTYNTLTLFEALDSVKIIGVHYV